MIDRDLPLKKEISNNIKKLIKERGWTQMKLSEKSGISKSTLSDYINCKTLINPGNVEKLAETFNIPKFFIDPSFNITIDGVVYPYESVENNIYVNSIVKLPIVGKISCGNGSIAFEEIDGYEATPKEWLNGGEYFYLRAKGDSMVNARIQEGDLLLIRKQEEVENGEIAAILIDDEAVLKRVYINNGTLILQSENPKYQPIVITNDTKVTIIGKLKKVVFNL